MGLPQLRRLARLTLHILSSEENRDYKTDSVVYYIKTWTPISPLFDVRRMFLIQTRDPGGEPRLTTRFRPGRDGTPLVVKLIVNLDKQSEVLKLLYMNDTILSLLV